MNLIRQSAGAIAALALAFPAVARAQAVQHPYATPYGVELAVTTGETVFVAGSYELADTLHLGVDIASTMPGSMGIPFGFKIRAGDYLQSRDGAQWTYFCAPLDRATASFPGLGVVVADGDCVGVRRRKSDDRLEWVVDNSIKNGMTTIWSRKMTAAEIATVGFTKTQAISNASLEKAVTFDGFYSGLLTFTYVEGSSKRELRFDYDGKSEKLIGMLGKRMLVLKADSVELRYKWIAPAAPAAPVVPAPAAP